MLPTVEELTKKLDDAHDKCEEARRVWIELCRQVRHAKADLSAARSSTGKKARGEERNARLDALRQRVMAAIDRPDVAPDGRVNARACAEFLGEPYEDVLACLRERLGVPC